MNNAERNPANGTEWERAFPTKSADSKQALAVDLDPGARKEDQLTNHDKGQGHGN
jgi:hypothetical protein